MGDGLSLKGVSCPGSFLCFLATASEQLCSTKSSTSEQDEGSAQNGGGGLGAESVALTEAWALSGAWGGPRERHGLHL